MQDSTPGSTAERACSLCGDARAGGAGRRSAPAIGRPFEPCWRCGGLIERAGTTEWDLHDRGARWSIAARRARFALAAGLVPCLVYTALALTSDRPWRRDHALLFLGAGWLLLGIWEAARLFSEINASRRRMGDPMYRARLVQHGIAASRAALEGR